MLACRTPARPVHRAAPRGRSGGAARPGSVVRALSELGGASGSDIAAKKRELLDLLAELQRRWGPTAALLPPSAGTQADETRAKIDKILAQLEDSQPHFRRDPKPFSRGEADPPDTRDTRVLGDWRLVYASAGTVVTRTPFAQSLAQLDVPGVGLGEIVQRLTVDAQGVVRTANEAEIKLGPFGSWMVGADGSWLNAGDGRTVDVVFDAFRLKMVSFLGLDLSAIAPQLVLGGSGAGQRDTRSGALWETTYVDDELRVGKGTRSGNLFVFVKRVA